MIFNVLPMQINSFVESSVFFLYMYIQYIFIYFSDFVNIFQHDSF